MSSVTGETVRLIVSIGNDHLDPEEVEDALRWLRDELLELDTVARVDPVSAGAAPAGSRSVDTGVLAALAIAVSHPEVLGALIETVRGWATRQDRTVKVDIDGDVLELTGVTSLQQQQIIDAWLRRRAEVPR